MLNTLEIFKILIGVIFFHMLKFKTCLGLVRLCGRSRRVRWGRGWGRGGGGDAYEEERQRKSQG
jgi:hypothetical protein